MLGMSDGQVGHSGHRPSLLWNTRMLLTVASTVLASSRNAIKYSLGFPIQACLVVEGIVPTFEETILNTIINFPYTSTCTYMYTYRNPTSKPN